MQFGSGLAKTVFDDAGPGGTVFLRVLFAAVLLMLLWRPRIGAVPGRDLLLAGLFGVALAGMNFSFYLALDRIPLGVAVTFEFLGPLGVAVAASRHAVDLLWVALAAAGILLLSDFGDFSSLDVGGVGLALLAGSFWAAYILLSARVGQVFPGGAGLALALVASTVLLAPVGIADGGGSLLEPAVLGTGAAVAMLSSAIPYSLELEALRSLPKGVFGVLMSLEPAMAALAGYVVLGEILVAREVVAVGLVVVASAGAARSAPASVEIPK